MANKLWIGITTVSSAKEGKKIAKNLIVNKLAACVNIIPRVNSFFYWEGKICAERESLLLIKTTGQQIRSVMKKIKEEHSYQVPEIIFWPIGKIDKNYENWVRETVTTRGMRIAKKVKKLDIKNDR